MKKTVVISFLLSMVSLGIFSQKTIGILNNKDIKTVFDFKNGEDVFRVWDSILHGDQNYFDVISDEQWILPVEYYYKKALKEKDSVLAFKLTYPLAYLYHTTTRFDRAIPLLESLSKKKKNIPDLYEIVLLKLEESYIRTGNLKPAIDVRNSRIKENYTNHFWEIYAEVGLYDEAIIDYRTHIHFPKSEPWHSLFYYYYLGNLFFKNEQLDSAQMYYLKAHDCANLVIADTNYAGKSFYSEYTKYYYRSLMMGSIAEIYMKQKQYAKAIPLLKEDVEKSKSIAEISNAIVKRIDLAECYLKLNELVLTKAYMDTVSSLMKINKWFYFDFRNYKLRSDYFLKIKQFDSAAVNLNKYVDLNQTIEDRLRKNKAIVILTIMDTDKQRATVATQKLELESAKLKVAEHQAQKNLLYGGVAVLIIALLGVIYNGLQKAKRRKEIEKSLREKDVLLKEVHHRVKNNLTTLKSLLYLQAKASNNTEVKSVLEECQMRIQSMALIHQNLYEESESEHVEFRHFIEQLFEALEFSFKSDIAQVDVDINCNDVQLDMSMALFLGLILNELVTNSYKHAFKNRTAGKIGLDISKVNNKITVTYFDDGQGLAGGFDDEMVGFGFKLIRILTQQINAKLVYSKLNKLSTFTITIYETA